MSGVKLTHDAFRRLQTAIRRIPRIPPNRSRNRQNDFKRFWVTLTGFNTDPDKRVYQWSTMTFDTADPSSFIPADAAITGDNAHWLDNSSGHLVNQQVELELLCTDDSGNLHYKIIPPQMEMRVLLQEDGTGDAGDENNPPSWSYNAFCPVTNAAILDDDGNAIEGIDPVHNRPLGRTIAATRGVLRSE